MKVTTLQLLNALTMEPVTEEIPAPLSGLRALTFTESIHTDHCAIRLRLYIDGECVATHTDPVTIDVKEAQPFI